MLFKEDKNDDDIKLVCLKSTNDNYELSIIKNILDENDIPYLLHDSGTGGYMRIATGMSLFGTDIMINEDDYEEAKDLMDSIFQ